MNRLKSMSVLRAGLLLGVVAAGAASATSGASSTTATIATSAAASSFSVAGRRCSPDAVAVGSGCLDKYEASVWRVSHPATTNEGLVRKIQQGRATRADLIEGGATQLGLTADDYAPCERNGANCADDIYAVSLPSEIPSGFINWFQ